MALAHVQTIKTLQTFPTTLTSAPITTTAGNLLVFAVSSNNDSLFSGVSDSKSNTWTPVAASPLSFAGGASGLRMYYAKNITADASHTFTVTNTGGNDTSFWVMEISGADITAPHDQSSGQGLGSTTAISSGTTATRTNANDILVSAFCTQQTNIVSVTAGAGYTLPSPDPSIFNAATANPGSIEYQIVSSVGTDDGTFTVGAAPGASGCIVAAFKAAGTVGDLSAFPGEPQTGSSKIQGGLR